MIDCEENLNFSDVVVKIENLEKCKVCQSYGNYLMISFKYKENLDSFLFQVTCAKCKSSADTIDNWNSGNYYIVGRKKIKTNRHKK